MSFKVAPRYLSGVSIFYGDDVNRREFDGELAIFIGPSTKGPSVPVELTSPDYAVALYGTDSPLMKALYQFYDGYMDAGKKQQMKFVTYRIGGIKASLTTSYGVSLETKDAYNGIENDYFVYINDATAQAAKIKIWDKNKALVYDSSSYIDTGHFTIDSLPVGTSGLTYGVDISADPLETPVTLAQIQLQDNVNPSGSALTPSGNILANATSVVVSEATTLFPSTGILKITETTGALVRTVYVPYTAKNDGTKTFTITAPGTAFTTSADISLIGSTLIKGDSQLDMTNRELYEYFRNALLDVEMHTPDYVIPGGVTYNATEKFNKSYNDTAWLKTSTVPADASIIIDKGATWPSTGTIDIFTGGADHNYVKYSSIAPSASNFALTIDKPTFNITAGATNGSSSLTVTAQNGGSLEDLLTAGYITLGGVTVHYTRAALSGTLTVSPVISAGAVGATTCQKVVGTNLANTTRIDISYTKLENFELGFGYVKETDLGDKFSFEWSNTKQAGYYAAHFGYLFGKFCNEAAVGYNTPLCGMNVDISNVKSSGFSRSSISSFVGKLPTYSFYSGDESKVVGIGQNGTGLLGEATLAGSINFNRSALSDEATGFFADPAYGLLLTEEGFIDGAEMRDTYDNLIDLGKFVLVGGALLTFSNKSSNKPYTDSCGIYALGQLAGKAKNEGISFSKIGGVSNARVDIIVNRNLYNDLARLGYIVVTREKGLGWVINNSHSAARDDSKYMLISTTRTVKYVVEGKRAILNGFIGKPVTRMLYEAARTRIAESFGDDVKGGFLATNPKWDIVMVESNQAIGKFDLICELTPALELTQVTIDATFE